MAGRHSKQNADYFSHENNMRNDKKLKAVRAKFDLRGYAIYNMILESLAESDLLMIENSELEIEMMAGDFGIDSEELNKLFDYFKKINLLKVTKKFIWCPQLDSRLKPIFDKRNTDLLQLRVNFCKINSINITEIGINSTEKDIVKESKVNKSKEKKIKYSDFVSLSKDEYQKLIKEHGEEATKSMIEILNNYKGANGKSYKSDYLAILNWVVKRYAEEKKAYQDDDVFTPIKIDLTPEEME
jgi:hypothetical protein